MLPVIAVLIIAAATWGLSTVSQSYTAAAQAQAAIEAAQAAQIASSGNVVSIMTTALVVLLVIVIVVGAIWLFYHIRIKPVLVAQAQGRRFSGAKFGQIGRSDPNTLLSTMTTMMMLQMLQQMQCGMPIAHLETRNEESMDWLTRLEK